MALEYTTAKRRKDPIPFTLDNREFMFTPPKLAGAVLNAIDSDDEGAILDWFAGGLTGDDEAFIVTRLRDDDDDFDITDIANIVKMLIEKVAGRPTKSSSGLRRRR